MIEIFWENSLKLFKNHYSKPILKIFFKQLLFKDNTFLLFFILNKCFF